MTMNERAKSTFGVPGGGAWYWKQDIKDGQPGALTHYRESGSNGFIVSWDKDIAMNRAFAWYSGPQEFFENLLLIVPERRFGYELIPENAKCKAYMDIEWIGANDLHHTVLSSKLVELRHSIETQLMIAPNIYMVCGSRPKEEGRVMKTKNLYHLVIKNVIFNDN